MKYTLNGVKASFSQYAFLFVLPSLFFTLNAWSAPSKPLPGKPVQNMTVDEAVELALSRNLELKQRKLTLDAAKIAYDNAWATMFMPNVSMSLASTSEYSLTAVKGSPAAKDKPASLNRGYPSSTASLTLASYTLFNFFRDRLTFDNAQMAYDRAEQQYAEARRSIRFRTISAYFRAKTEQDKLDAAKRSVDISREIVNLLKSRKALGGANQDDISSSSVDLLNAEAAFDFQDKVSYEANAALSFLIDANILQKFNLVTPIRFTPLKIQADEAFKVFKTSAPAMRDNLLQLRVAENNVELYEKNRLPLPTISFSGVSVSYSQNYGGPSNTLANSRDLSSPGGQINLEAVVSLTLPIFGPGGFLGSRTVAAARIQRDSSELAVTQISTNGEFEIQKKIESIKRQEVQIKNLKQAFEASAKLLESVFSKMTGKSMNRLELRDALSSARASEINYLEALVEHLVERLALAEFIGTDQISSEEGAP